jgi:hypothetical protein
MPPQTPAKTRESDDRRMCRRGWRIRRLWRRRANGDDPKLSDDPDWYDDGGAEGGDVPDVADPVTHFELGRGFQ